MSNVTNIPYYDKPVRVYDLARRVELPVKDAMERLNTLGASVTNHANTISAELANRFLVSLQPAKPATPPATPVTTPEPAPTATQQPAETPSAPAPILQPRPMGTGPRPTESRPSQEPSPSLTPVRREEVSRPVGERPVGERPAAAPQYRQAAAGSSVQRQDRPIIVRSEDRRDGAAGVRRDSPPPSRTPAPPATPRFAKRERTEGAPITSEVRPASSEGGGPRVAYSSRMDRNDTTRGYRTPPPQTPPARQDSRGGSPMGRDSGRPGGTSGRPTGGFGGRPSGPRPMGGGMGSRSTGGRPGAAPAEGEAANRGTGRSRGAAAKERERAREAFRENIKDKELTSKLRISSRDTDELVLPRRDELVEIMEASTVGEMAQALGVRPNTLIAHFVRMGILATVNQSLDMETLEKLSDTFHFIPTKRPTLEEVLLAKVDVVEDDPSALIPRPPVVTIMGHVDHGKTSLLDAVRKTNIAEKEAGNITQHIGAYNVHLPDGRVVFLDTPGHEAFTAMRARGAQVTDVVVLVVAADDGVMPQTVEALNHARAAEVSIVVAVNKMDVPGANIERVKDQLARLELIPEEWGGKTVFCEISAKLGTGVQELLEYLALETELLELKANPNRSAIGAVIEAKLDKGRGPVATILVQNGTLRVGDFFAAGPNYGRVRALLNDLGQNVKDAGPSTPVEVLGFNGVPNAGDRFIVLPEEDAKTLAENRLMLLRDAQMALRPRVSLDDLHTQIELGKIKELNIIVKADVEGSLDPILAALRQLDTREVKVRVIHQGVGAVTETDVMLAAASSAIIIGFNVRATPKAASTAQREGVDTRFYDIIYNVVNDIKAGLEGLLEPEVREQALGRATVRELFRVPRLGVIAGCYVNNGKMVRGGRVRVLRDNRVVHEGVIDSLRRFKEDVGEVAAGYECGIGLRGFMDFKEGDVFECYMHEKVARTLESSPASTPRGSEGVRE